MKPPLRTKSAGTKVSEAEFALLEERARGAGLRLAEWVRRRRWPRRWSRSRVRAWTPTSGAGRNPGPPVVAAPNLKIFESRLPAPTNLTDGSVAAGLPLADQDGQPTTADGMTGRWHHPIVDLSSQQGKTVDFTYFLTDGETAPGDWSVDYRDVTLLRADGLVQQLYHGENTSINATSGMTNLSSPTITQGLGPGGVPMTHYYLGDHLGTAQLEFATGGWPVWSGDFDPYGQEVQPQSTRNNYKFTGKERDAETGLDFFGARYYNGPVARWLSPDWSAKAEAVPYARVNSPQSLDLYTYVLNNPLSRIDADGHWPDWATNAVATTVKALNFINPLTRVANGVVAFQTVMQVNDSYNDLYKAAQNNLIEGKGTPAQLQVSQDAMQDAQKHIQMSAVPLVEAVKAVVEGLESVVPDVSANVKPTEKAMTKGAGMAVKGLKDVIEMTPDTPDQTTATPVQVQTPTPPQPDQK